jgi:FlaG/FlaF family flagellin (archaellin)
VDTLLASGMHYDSVDHPNIAAYLFVYPADQQCIEFVDYTPATGCPVNVSASHVSVDASIAAGAAYPVDHPDIDNLLRPYMSVGHRNVDDLLRAGTPLPIGHPPVDDYLCNEVISYGDQVKMCASHEDIDSLLAFDAGPYSFPTTHPTMQPLLSKFLPADHPDVDTLLASGMHYDSVDHPNIAAYLFVYPAYQQCIEFVDYTPATGCPVNVSATHVSVDASIAAGAAYPVNHPDIDNLLRPYMSVGHRNIDDLLRAGTPLPIGHPPVDDYLCNEVISEADKVVMCASHEDIDSLLAFGAGPYSFPTTHPTMQPLLSKFLPADHPDVDTLLASGMHYDSVDHPNIAVYLNVIPADQQCMDFSGAMVGNRSEVKVPYLRSLGVGDIRA